MPCAAFRSRGYSREELNLKSLNLRNDTLVVLVILAVEAAGELSMSGIFKLSGYQILLGSTVSLIVHLLGTGLPVMIFLYIFFCPGT